MPRFLKLQNLEEGRILMNEFGGQKTKINTSSGNGVDAEETNIQISKNNFRTASETKRGKNKFKQGPNAINICDVRC